jgi:hypothetical protein
MVTTVYHISRVRGFGQLVHVGWAALDGGKSHASAHKAACLSGLIESQTRRVKVRAFKKDSRAYIVHMPGVLGGIILKRSLPMRWQNQRTKRKKGHREREPREKGKQESEDEELKDQKRPGN